jgi:hypothetical protein
VVQAAVVYGQPVHGLMLLMSPGGLRDLQL